MTERRIIPTVMPTDTLSYRRPIKHFSVTALNRIWHASRDAGKHPGVKGVDGITARQFSQNLDNNLSHLSLSLRDGTFRFNKLRAYFPPKKSGGFRVICVPTVSDRLIQRAIGDSLTAKDRFKLINDASYGFIRGRGVRDAIEKAIAERTRHEWVLKTDIQSYFDRIRRDELATKIKKKLGSHSLVPLLLQAINCEVEPRNQQDKEKLASAAITRGRGLRQGMPLSPLLSNLVLGDFDRTVLAAGFNIIRYADDIIVFGRDKSEIENAYALIAWELRKLGHTLPERGPDSKTQFVAPKQPVEFLGIELVFKDSANSYICRIPAKVKNAVLAEVSNSYSYIKAIDRFADIGALSRSLSGVPAAYRNVYSHADDWSAFEPQLKKECSRAFSQLYETIFGKSAIAGLSEKQRLFLGIHDLDFE